ncbi:MAG: uncharacterized protein KVP18_002947 [Porospora cf. gigantea A]|uniref:uncharacterized protein n=1 Tax=Porospora cf. gigantea A TaxID=2853593 RepID=UPI00355A3882|nr:MAG: hypothetical protein KVP18_002947 [Porospora cf. gigantea A]
MKKSLFGRVHRWLSIGIILVFGFAASKWYIGWSFLSVVLFEIGAYENLCTPEQIAANPGGTYSCAEQNIAVNQINLFTRFVWGGTMVMGGFLYDWSNSPLLCGGVGVAAFALSLVFFIISDESLPLWNWAVMLMGFNSALFSIVTVDIIAHLVPHRAAMWTGLNYGAQYLGTAIPIGLSVAATANPNGFGNLILWLLTIYVPLMVGYVGILPFMKHHKAVEEVAFGPPDPEIEYQLFEDNAYSECFETRQGSILDLEPCDPTTPNLRHLESDPVSPEPSIVSYSNLSNLPDRDDCVEHPDFGPGHMDFSNYQNRMTGAQWGHAPSASSKISFRVGEHLAKNDLPVSIESVTSGAPTGCRHRNPFLREALSLEMILFECSAGFVASTLGGYWYTVVLHEFGPAVNAFLGYITPLYFVFGPLFGQISQKTSTCFSLSIATLFITLAYFLGMIENEGLRYFACFIFTMGASHANAAGPSFILEVFGRERFGKHTGVVHVFYTIFVLPPIFISQAQINADVIFPIFGILGFLIVLVLFGLDWYIREASVFRRLREKRRERLQRRSFDDSITPSGPTTVRRRDTITKMWKDLRSPPVVPRPEWTRECAVQVEIVGLAEVRVEMESP